MKYASWLEKSLQSFQKVLELRTNFQNDSVW